MLGNQKQEKKIAMMGDVAHQMFPAQGVMVFKGCFRQGISKTMKDHHVSEWKSVAALPPRKREHFFREALENSRKPLRGIGLNDDDIAGLFRELTLENKAYLAN